MSLLEKSMLKVNRLEKRLTFRIARLGWNLFRDLDSSMCGSDQSQLIAMVMYFVDVSECTDIVYFGQVFDDLRLIVLVFLKKYADVWFVLFNLFTN